MKRFWDVRFWINYFSWVNHPHSNCAASSNILNYQDILQWKMNQSHVFTFYIVKFSFYNENWSQSHVFEIEAWDNLFKLSHLETTLSMTALCQILYLFQRPALGAFQLDWNNLISRNNLIATINYVTSASSPSC